MNGIRLFFACALTIVALLPLAFSQSENEIPDRLIMLFENKLQQAGIPADPADPESLSEIIKWSKKNDLLTHCSYWLEYYTSRFPEHLPLRMALADCYFSSADWGKLKQIVSQDSWQFQEHLRLNYLAFAQRELADSQWPLTWQAALSATKNNAEKKKSLILFLAQWKKWDTELESLLWQQVDQSNPLNAMALNSLVRLYELQNNAAGLLKINEHLLDLDPTNPELLNNEVSIHVLTRDLSSLKSDFLESLRSHSDLDSKYNLTLALYHQLMDQPATVKEYLSKIPGTWFEQDQERLVYLDYLRRIRGEETSFTDEAYRKLVETGNFQGFERAFLLSVID